MVDDTKLSSLRFLAQFDSVYKCQVVVAFEKKILN